MDKENKVTNRVSLAPSTWELFLDEAAKIGDPGNRSAGLRAIIAKYRRLAVGVSPVEMAHVATDAAYGAAVEAGAMPDVASAVYTSVVQAIRDFDFEGSFSPVFNQIAKAQAIGNAAYTAAVEAQASPEVASAVYAAVVQAMRKFMEKGR